MHYPPNPSLTEACGEIKQLSQLNIQVHTWHGLLSPGLYDAINFMFQFLSIGFYIYYQSAYLELNVCQISHLLFSYRTLL